MKINVRLFANFREAVGKKDLSLETNGGNVMAVVLSLIALYPSLGPLMLHKGGLKPYVNVLVNGKKAETTDRVKEGDEVAIFPPVSGG
jgi:MoaD family protein